MKLLLPLIITTLSSICPGVTDYVTVKYFGLKLYQLTPKSAAQILRLEQIMYSGQSVIFWSGIGYINENVEVIADAKIMLTVFELAELEQMDWKVLFHDVEIEEHEDTKLYNRVAGRTMSSRAESGLKQVDVQQIGTTLVYSGRKYVLYERHTRNCSLYITDNQELLCLKKDAENYDLQVTYFFFQKIDKGEYVIRSTKNPNAILVYDKEKNKFTTELNTDASPNVTNDARFNIKQTDFVNTWSTVGTIRSKSGRFMTLASYTHEFLAIRPGYSGSLEANFVFSADEEFDCKVHSYEIKGSTVPGEYLSVSNAFIVNRFSTDMVVVFRDTFQFYNEQYLSQTKVEAQTIKLGVGFKFMKKVGLKYNFERTTTSTETNSTLYGKEITILTEKNITVYANTTTKVTWRIQMSKNGSHNGDVTFSIKREEDFLYYNYDVKEYTYKTTDFPLEKTIKILRKRRGDFPQSIFIIPGTNYAGFKESLVLDGVQNIGDDLDLETNPIKDSYITSCSEPGGKWVDNIPDTTGPPIIPTDE